MRTEGTAPEKAPASQREYAEKAYQMKTTAAEKPTGILSEYLDDDHLAAELNVGPRTLHRWRRLGTAPPHIVVGRVNLTHVDAVRKWLTAGGVR